MGLQQWISRLQHPEDLPALARDIARTCHSRISQHVSGQMALMSLAEARGYIRAHSRPVVSVELVRTLSGRQLSGEDRRQVENVVMQSVIQSCVREMLHRESIHPLRHAA
jgi:hypothetical protein